MSITKNKLNVLPLGPIPIDAETMRDMQARGALPEGIGPPLKEGVDYLVPFDPNGDFTEEGVPNDAKHLRGAFYNGLPRRK